MKFNKFLTNTLLILTGMCLLSKWITHSNNWEFYLPFILIIITVKFLITENNNTTRS